MKTWIMGGQVIDPLQDSVIRAEIVLSDGKILGIVPPGGEEPAEGDEVIRADGLLTGPGLVDVHVHFRDPGFPDKEDILTGAEAAKAGGFTTVVCMANTRPVVDNEETLRYCLEKGKKTGIHVLQTAAVTKGLAGKELTDMEALAAAGAAGFTDDGIPLMNANLVREAMLRVKALGLPISFHEEDPALIGENGINHGAVSEKLGIYGSPAVAESSITARDLEIALDTGARVDIQHVSAARTVAAIAHAKKRGADVWAEVTPHHFTLTEQAVLEYGTLAKMNPPLRTEEDRQALLKGLSDGTMDVIATDHAPHTAKEKARDLTKAPSGIIGLETALALGVTELVKKGILTYPELFRKMSKAPAELYHLQAGTLLPGADADLVIFDDTTPFTAGKYRSRASNSPFTGRTLYGRVKYTICGGHIVYRDE